MSTNQIKAPKFPGYTLSLSDTIDQWGRKVHINIRNGKVTLVHRWNSRKDNKKHTQRTTLDDSQVGRLLAALTVAGNVATNADAERAMLMGDEVTRTLNALDKLSRS